MGQISEKKFSVKKLASNIDDMKRYTDKILKRIDNMDEDTAIMEVVRRAMNVVYILCDNS